MKYYSIIALSLLIGTPALAQVPNDPDFLKKTLGVLENQRNQCLTNQTLTEVKLMGKFEDLDKANSKIKELEAKVKELEPKKDE